MSKGNSTIVGPDGDVLAGPLVGATGIVAADLELDRIAIARRQFDPVGHYARPDVFSLHVDTRPKPAVTFTPDVRHHSRPGPQVLVELGLGLVAEEDPARLAQPGRLRARRRA